MSARLIGGLVEWRRTPAGAELTDKEFIVLFTIADRVMDAESSRLMRRFRGDDCELYERLCQVAGVDQPSLKKVLQRLAGRGLEVRVVYKHDKNGNPVYACKGHAMDFRFPELPVPVPVELRLVEDLDACG